MAIRAPDRANNWNHRRCDVLVDAKNYGRTCMHKVRRAPLDLSSTCLASWYQISLFNHSPPPIFYLIKLSGWVGVLLTLGETKTVWLGKRSLFKPSHVPISWSGRCPASDWLGWPKSQMRSVLIRTLILLCVPASTRSVNLAFIISIWFGNINF